MTIEGPRSEARRLNGAVCPSPFYEHNTQRLDDPAASTGPPPLQGLGDLLSGVAAMTLSEDQVASELALTMRSCRGRTPPPSSPMRRHVRRSASIGWPG